MIEQMNMDFSSLEKQSVPGVLLSKCYVGPYVGYTNKLIQAKVINVNKSPLRGEGSIFQIIDVTPLK